jgi:disulfide bond formation protein DsbB
MNPLAWSFRTAFAACAVISAAFLGYAVWSQFNELLEPCPLCQFQRLAFVLLIVVCIAAAVQNPKGSAGRRVYGVLAFVASAIGFSIAARHTWLQHLPPDQVPECGPGLNYLVQTFPIGDVLRKVFTGSGECAKVDWTFLGLSMPEWNLFWFGFFAISALYYGFRRYRA